MNDSSLPSQSHEPGAPDISVVVPVYNEEENVALLQREIETALFGRNFEIVFVDDGSRDATAEKIQRDSHTRVLRFEKNTGQSAATYAGLKSARGDIVILMDGDLQNDPADIPRLLQAMSQADLVCGYRANRKDTAVKRATSRVANFVRSRFTGDGVRDTGCGMKAMKRECVSAIIPFKGMHRFVPALVRGAGYHLVEVPVNHRPRQFGSSKYGLGNRAIRATVDMFGVRWLLSRRFSYRIRPD